MIEKLIKIQLDLKSPKNQRNSFGGFDYRSCEDILEAVKPLLAREKLLLTLQDKIVCIGGRNYVKATAELSDGTKEMKFTAYAREEETKKGMDGSQITGASSSYARKYALNGLFLIDDAEDSDSTNKGEARKPARNSGTPYPASDKQKKLIFALGTELGKDGESTKEWVKKSAGIASYADLTSKQASAVIDKLNTLKTPGVPQDEPPMTDEQAEEFIQQSNFE